MFIENIRIGENIFGNPVFTSRTAGNHHISVTGMSGSAKTVWLTFLETWLASKGATVIVLDYADTHNLERMSSPWQSDFARLSKTFDVKQDGIPFPLWPKHLSGEEDRRGDILTVLDIVSKTAKLSTIQRACLLNILERTVYQHRFDQSDELDSLLASIEEYAKSCLSDEKREIRRIYTKLALAAKSTKIAPEQAMIPGKINILKVDYGDYTGLAVCNLILDLLWQDMRSRKADHAQETFLVLDEYQHLDLIHDDAPLSNMLREGRRYGLSVILSTQNLSGFTVKEKELVNQAATKIYFRQTKRDAFEITKGFPEKERRTMANTLTSLRVGQCCAEGIFSIDKMLKDSMVTLNIRKQKQIAITVPSVRRTKVLR